MNSSPNLKKKVISVAIFELVIQFTFNVSDYALAIPKNFKCLVLSVDDTEGKKKPWVTFAFII